MPFKRGNSDIWWISYRAEGKTGRVARSSFTTDWKQAQEMETACRAHYIQTRDAAPEGQKRCTRCSALQNRHVFKPIAEFSKKHAWCKKCHSQYGKDHYQRCKARQEELLERDKRGHVLFKPDKIGKSIHQFLMADRAPAHAQRMSLAVRAARQRARQP